MIANGTPISGPFNIMVKPETITAKEFKIGDQINFEDQDLNSIYETFQMFTVVLQSRVTTIITTLNFIQIIATSKKTKRKYTLK